MSTLLFVDSIPGKGKPYYVIGEQFDLPDSENCLYRITGEFAGEYDYERTVRLWVQSIPIVKRTERGVWIQEWYGAKKRFVLNDSRKRYAYPTKREALDSLLYRKHRHIEILRFQLRQAVAVRNAVKSIIEERDGRSTSSENVVVGGAGVHVPGAEADCGLD